MFSQLLTPVADSLGLSFLVAVLPIVTVLIFLACFACPPGSLRWPGSSLR